MELHVYTMVLVARVEVGARCCLLADGVSARPDIDFALPGAARAHRSGLMGQVRVAETGTSDCLPSYVRMLQY